MKLSESIKINKPLEIVWKTITDFNNCVDFIESIKEIEILNEPKNTLVGFKWKETREMFGKIATETMWITDFKENDFYQTCSESHGSIYFSRLSIKSLGNNTVLTMSFSAKAQTLIAKVLSRCMGFVIKGAMKKALLKDLNDIKNHLEPH